jgi:hypothetical protein
MLVHDDPAADTHYSRRINASLIALEALQSGIVLGEGSDQTFLPIMESTADVV